MQKCPACGQKIEDGAGFCPYCDAEVFGAAKGQKKSVKNKPYKAQKAGWWVRITGFITMRDTVPFTQKSIVGIRRFWLLLQLVPLALLMALEGYFTYYYTVYARMGVFVFDIFRLARTHVDSDAFLGLLLWILVGLAICLVMLFWQLFATVFRQKTVYVLSAIGAGVWIVLLVIGTLWRAPVFALVLYAVFAGVNLMFCLWLWQVPKAGQLFCLTPRAKQQQRPPRNTKRRIVSAFAGVLALALFLPVFGGILTEAYVTRHINVVPGTNLVWPGTQETITPIQELPLAGAPYSTYIPNEPLLNAENAVKNNTPLDKLDYWPGYTVVKQGDESYIAFADGRVYPLGNVQVVQEQISPSGTELYVLLYNGAQYTELYCIGASGPRLIAANVGKMKMSLDGSALYYTVYEYEQGKVWMCGYDPLTAETWEILDVAVFGRDAVVTQKDGWPALYNEAGEEEEDFAVSPNGEYVLFNSYHGLILHQRSELITRHLGVVQRPVAVANNGRSAVWYNLEQEAFVVARYGDENAHSLVYSAQDIVEGPACYTNNDASQIWISGNDGLYYFQNGALVRSVEVGPAYLVLGENMPSRQEVSKTLSDTIPVCVVTGARNMQSILYSTKRSPGDGFTAEFEDLYFLQADKAPIELARGEGCVSVSSNGQTLHVLAHESGNLKRIIFDEDGSMHSQTVVQNAAYFVASPSGLTLYYVPQGSAQNTLICYTETGRKRTVTEEYVSGANTALQVARDGESCLFVQRVGGRNARLCYWSYDMGIIDLGVYDSQAVPQSAGYTEAEGLWVFFEVEDGLYFYSNEQTIKLI